jgi:hypothetical protein
MNIKEFILFYPEEPEEEGEKKKGKEKRKTLMSQSMPL